MTPPAGQPPDNPPPETPPARKRPAQARQPKARQPKAPSPAPAPPAVEVPPPEGTLPVTKPSPPEPPKKGGRFGWGTVVFVALAALGGGVAFGAFGPGFGWGGQPGPSPTPNPSPTPSPTVFVETTRLTIPEGFTAEDIFERASETLDLPIEDFEAAAADPSAIGLPTEANGSVEGWLGAFTYQVPETATAVDVLAEMVDATLMHLDNRGVDAADRLEILTKASLIEKEVRLADDRPKVARVIENRLTENWPLQFDSTVHYVVGGDSPFTTAEDRLVDSPYNTYRYIGIPPGPICSPGLPSVDAVLSPVDGPWMFFVTVNLDTGETRFATTLEEHEANVEILREWMAANEG